MKNEELSMMVSAFVEVCEWHKLDRGAAQSKIVVAKMKGESDNLGPWRL